MIRNNDVSVKKPRVDGVRGNIRHVLGCTLSVAILTTHRWHARRKIALLKIMLLFLPIKGLV